MDNLVNELKAARAEMQQKHVTFKLDAVIAELEAESAGKPADKGSKKKAAKPD